MRPVDADALMAKLNRKKAGPANQRYTEGFNDCLMRVRSMVHSAPTLTPPNEWVSVEERLPTDEHPVLVFVGYADTMTGFITTSSYFCFDANPHWQWDGLVRDEQRTLFWMPLPEPPDRRPPEGESDD